MRQAGTWDLGPFSVVLQCLHLDITLFQQQSTKKLHGTKNNCVHVQLGQIQDQRNKQTNKKNQFPLLKSLEQRLGVRSKSRVLHTPHHLRGGQNTAPTLIPHKDQAHPTQGVNNKGTCYLFLLPTAAAGVPRKPCLNFLSGL